VRDKIVRLYREGVLLKDIAAATGYTFGGLSGILDAARRDGQIGRRNHLWTDQEILTAQTMRLDGKTVQEIAAHFGVSVMSADCALNNPHFKKRLKQILDRIAAGTFDAGSA